MCAGGKERVWKEIEMKGEKGWWREVEWVEEKRERERERQGWREREREQEG